jgi:two-component system sensor histidine kinase/response regulator
MKPTSLPLAAALFVSVCCLAQNTDSERLRNLSSHAYQTYLSDPDSAIAISRETLDLALQSGNKYFEGYSYFLLCKAYWVKANFRLSAEFGFKALRLFQDSPYRAELAETRLGLARDLAELGDIPKARQLIAETLRTAIADNDKLNEANAYRECSFLLAEANQLDSALMYTDKALAFFFTNGDSVDISILYGRKSRIYFEQQNFDQSRLYAYKALAIDSLVGNRRALAISLCQVAQNEYALGNITTSINLLKRSAKISDEIGNLPWQIKARDLLSKYYLELNKPALAAAELQKVSQIKDRLHDYQKSGQLQAMQSLHELEAKENTIKLLENENALKLQEVRNQRLFVAFLLAVVVLLALLTIVLTRLRSIQHRTNKDLARKNRAIEQQKTEIAAQAEEFRQLNQVKTKLFSVISHDLRGPISNLQSLLELFTNKLVSAKEFISLSDKLKESLNATQRTLENLLNWSLSQMGGIKTDKKNVDVAQCIDETCSLLEHAASRKNITIRKNISRPISAWVDQNQLQVVLRNLLHNAIKFSSFNDSIEVTAIMKDQHSYISIKDYGIGMTRQEIESIIGSSGYFSKAGTQQERGTGLGLLLCKEFIARNEGAFDIKSNLGEGTEVSLRLLAEQPEMVVTE